MKRATPTPNRFIISIPSWPVKALVILLGILVFVSCDDELAGIGIKKPVSRFKVYYREFDIPATTVQTDSVRSSVLESQRLFSGDAQDPIFGRISSIAYAQFYSDFAYLSPKIDITGKSNFTPTSLTLDFVFDNYVYGDTSDRALNFDLHRLYENSFPRKEFFAQENISYNPEVFASASYNYVQDSIVKYRKRNADSNTQNNKYDTLRFILPFDDYGKLLLDTATAKGVKRFDAASGTWKLSNFKTDSVFRVVFPGFALVANPTNGRIMGFNMANSVMTLKFSYVKDGAQLNGVITYRAYDIPSFSSVSYDRSSTPLNGLLPTDKYEDFAASDMYAYMQAGTGLYAKLDFTQLHNYFNASPDTIINMGLNGAELFVDGETKVERRHQEQASSMIFRVVKTNNRFFEVPVLSNSIFDPQFGTAYYCATGRRYLDALNEFPTEGIASLKLAVEKNTNRQIYSTFATQFFQKFLNPPKGFNKIYYMALIPGDGPFGKSFHGMSFKKDKVKLRIYYTKAL